MIDLGISKMALIGAVALIVIGPEKLPRVARTVGTLLGKAQRYVADVKAEVNRSMELDELKKMKDTVESAARDVESSHPAPAPASSRSSWPDAASTAPHGACRAAAVLPRIQAPQEEVAPEAGRHAALVQGAQRRAHQGAVGRGARGPLPPAEIQLSGPAARSHATQQEDELAGTEQPFVAHLVELRDRLIKAMIAIGVVAAVLVLYPGPGALYDILAAPLVAHLPKGATLIATSVISPFLVPLKILLMAAFLIALPVVLYQVWAFVAPGLYSHEKKLVLPLVVSSTLLFFVGVAFCYFFVFGQVFTFIQSFAPKSITAAPDIEAYLSFVLTHVHRLRPGLRGADRGDGAGAHGHGEIEKLKEFRGYFIVLAFIIAAVITPPDVVSQLALAMPMCLLYEVGIWAAQLFIKHTKAPEEGAAAADRAQRCG